VLSARDKACARSGLTVLFAAVFVTGCAGVPDAVRDYGESLSFVELEAVPFFPQERYQCGPAALATLLESSGIAASPEALSDRVFVPGREGSLQIELQAATRAAGRIPYRVDGSMAAVMAELRSGRPVLILQNLGVSWYPRWHYAVIVGVDPAADKVILRSGTVKRRITSTETLLRTWRRGDYWGFVALPPGELPASPNQARYFRAVSDMEATGHHTEALAGWQAALGYWPGSATARLGVANAAFALGDYRSAESAYRQLLTDEPDMLSARNNLAFALAGQGRDAEALAEIRRVLDEVADDDLLRPQFEASYRELLSTTQ
jgi:tetratricopeptide (TPR) repeat protein